MSVSDNIFNVMCQYTNRQWRIDGQLTYPTFDDVGRLLAAMVKDIREQGYDSIESGGILVKRDGNKVDVYVHVGEIDATNNSI